MKKINTLRVITINQDIELVYFWEELDNNTIQYPPNKQEAFLEIADLMEKHDIAEIKAIRFLTPNNHK